MEGQDKQDWFDFLEQLKNFAVRNNRLNFGVKNNVTSAYGAIQKSEEKIRVNSMS
jgi:hypothetical protein